MALTYSTKISSKGQIVIPLEIRKKLNLKPKTRFIIEAGKNSVTLKLKEEILEDTFGLFRGIKETSELLLTQARNEEKYLEKRKIRRFSP